MSHYTGAVPDTEPADQWHQRAACIGHADSMFPDNNEPDIAAAKNICQPCPVQTECVLDALRTGDTEYGIRGGLRPNERRNMARDLADRTRGETPATHRRPPRTLRSVWDANTQPRDGHLVWTASEPVSIGGCYYTPRQVAFRLDRGRPPVSIVRRTCDCDGCVLPAHLMDQVERDAHRRAAA